MEVSSGLFFPAPAQAPRRGFKPVKRLLRAVPVSGAQTFAAQKQSGLLKFREC